MSSHFYPLTIKDIRKETSECISIAFDIPSHLSDLFQFHQGQYINLKTDINGSEVRRSYSICSAPYEKELRVAVKQQFNGLFSDFANTHLQKGDVLEVMPPQGKFFTALNPSSKKNYLAIAAGSGITPVLSIIKETLLQEPQSEFTLIYGNRSRKSVIFFEELEAIKNKYINRFNLIHILSREKTDVPLNFGRIDEPKLNDLARLIDYSTIDAFFVCGPEELIFCAKEFLEAKGIDPKNIHFELFGTKPKAKQQHNSPAVASSSPSSHITVQLDGRSFSFDIPFSSDTTILDAAAQQDADVPYSCKGGVCCTCKAKLLEGEVSMDVHWGLEEEEIQQGYILTCQSHPKTEKIIVDFDVK
ncbi:MAG: 1,2-phenylacetyl-CoA epoxidase subunit PaaE [Chitinophagaceae bacterium]